MFRRLGGCGRAFHPLESADKRIVASSHLWTGREYQELGRLAQLVERLLYTQDVGGSRPSPPTKPKSTNLFLKVFIPSALLESTHVRNGEVRGLSMRPRG